MNDKKNNAATRLAGAAILVMAVTGVPALADPPASNDRVVTIQNTTNEPLELGTPEWPKGFSRGAPIPGECRQEHKIPAGGECQLPIRFDPSQVGPYAGELIIPVNDGKAPSLVIHLSGTGIAAAQSGGVRATERDGR